MLINENDTISSLYYIYLDILTSHLLANEEIHSGTSAPCEVNVQRQRVSD